MIRTPLLILSDSPTGPTGLGRVTRELAQKIATDLPEVRLGVAGLNAVNSRHLPYPLYSFSLHGNWEIDTLPRIWDDFAGSEKGIALTIWNVSWLEWLFIPSETPTGQFLKEKPFEKWAYVPVDGHCADGKMHPRDKPILEGFDRVLAYGEYGAKVIEKTLSRGPIPSIPHGIDLEVFFPREKEAARRRFGLPMDIFLVGVVATNTGRKDWPLAFATLKELRKQGVNASLWGHTDDFRKHWDLLTLAEIHFVSENILLTTTQLTDENMSWFYACCDVTLGIGLGEGFGLPCAESLACGVPCLTANYAGCRDYVPNEFLLAPDSWKTDGLFCIERPVLSPQGVVEAMMRVQTGNRSSYLPERLLWPNVWQQWKAFIQEGL